eukprot:jgi/Botrbrau1/5789/Bobra.0155s0012.1
MTNMLHTRLRDGTFEVPLPTLSRSRSLVLASRHSRALPWSRSRVLTQVCRT